MSDTRIDPCAQLLVFFGLSHGHSIAGVSKLDHGLGHSAKGALIQHPTVSSMLLSSRSVPATASSSNKYSAACPRTKSWSRRRR